MSLAFYLDDNIEQRALARELTKRGIDAMRATDAGNHAADDRTHLKFAARTGRILVSSDRDFQQLHWEWMAAEQSHAGILFVAPELSIGDRVRGLSALNAAFEPRMLENRLLFLKQWIER